MPSPDHEESWSAPPTFADVLVVGAGPTGLTLYGELLHQRAPGRHVLIDANVEPCAGSKLPKGQGIQPTTFELWARQSETLPATIRQEGRVPDHITPHFNAWDSERGVAKQAAADSLNAGLSPYPSGRVQQALYEARLRDHVASATTSAADATGGVCVGSTHFGWRVVSAEWAFGDGEQGEWHIHVTRSREGIAHYADNSAARSFNDEHSTPEEESRIIRTRILVGCDGGRSFVRKSLGVRLSGAGSLGVSLTPIFRAPALYANLRKQFHGAPDGLVYQFKKNGRPPSGIGVLTGTELFYGNISYKKMDDVPAHVVAADALGHDAMAAAVLQELKANCDCEFGAEVEALEGWRWQPYSLCAADFALHDGHAFLAGDAAHLLSPVGGFGMNGGVMDAVNLGWKLAAHLEGWLDLTQVASSYSQERRATWLRSNEYQQQELANAAAGRPRDTGKAYEHAMFGPAARRAVRGYRAPEVKLANGESLHRTLAKRSRGYTLALLDNDDASAACAASFESWAAKLARGQSKGSVLQILQGSQSTDEVESVYGAVARAFLIRPDGMISWCGPPVDLMALLCAGEVPLV